MSRPSRLLRPVFALLLCMLVPACANKVTKTNFDKVKDGMTLAEVEKILGKGTKEEGDGANVAGQFGVALPQAQKVGGGEIYKWEKGTKEITIYFREGKVVRKISSGF